MFARIARIIPKALAILLFVTLCQNHAVAVVLDIEIQTDSPGSAACGRVVGIIALNDGQDPILEYKWEVKGSAEGCNPPFVEFGGNSDATFVWDNRRGTVTIRLTASYVQPMQQPGMPPPPPGHPPTIIERTFEYQAADGVDWATLTYDSGDFTYGSTQWMTICASQGGITCPTPYSAHEKITVLVPADVPPPFGGGWSDNESPDVNMRAPDIHFSGLDSKFYDKKGLIIPIGAVGEIVYKYTQDIGLKYFDFCGNAHGPVTIATITVTCRRTSATTYNMTIEH